MCSSDHLNPDPNLLGLEGGQPGGDVSLTLTLTLTPTCLVSRADSRAVMSPSWEAQTASRLMRCTCGQGEAKVRQAGEVRQAGSRNGTQKKEGGRQSLSRSSAGLPRAGACERGLAASLRTWLVARPVSSLAILSAMDLGSASASAAAARAMASCVSSRAATRLET